MVCNPYLTVLIFLEESVGALLLLVSKMSCIISGDNPFNLLYISVASICRFLWWTVTDLSLGGVLQMMKNNYRQSWVPSHEFYLSYDLSVCYETSRLVGDMQTVKRQMLSW